MIGRPSPSASAREAKRSLRMRNTDVTERERARGEAVPDVMDAHVAEPGLRADAFPRRVDVRHVPARLGARNDPGTAGLARQGLEDADRRRR